MLFFLEIRFEDNRFSAIVHLATNLTVTNQNDANHLVEELMESMRRRKLNIISISCPRIDNNPQLSENLLRYYEFYKTRATATVELDQYVMDNPDQTKDLVENILEKILSGENSTAQVGHRYRIPVRVMDKKTKNSIEGDIYYLNLELLVSAS
jgi:hypothetical protein